MNIDKFKQEDGWYKNEDGVSFENAESFITTGMLDFCGCGSPDEAMNYVGDALRLIVNRQGLAYPEWEKETKKLFNSDGAEYFMWYFLDNKGLTEHGGSVPGWLTDKGKALLEDIEELKKQNET